MKTIGSIEKGMQVLEYISENAPCSLTEISTYLGLKSSSIYHIVNTLKHLKYVHQDRSTKKYQLGLKIWSLGQNAFQKSSFAPILKPYLDQLSEKTHETANLTELDGTNIIYTAQSESESIIKMFTKPGAIAPLYCTAAGKVFLANMTESELNDMLLKIKLIKYTHNTITSFETLRCELKEIYKNKYAMDSEERELGVSCLAAPIFDSRDKVIACFSISGPTTRFNSDKLNLWIPFIQELSNQVRKDLF